MVSNSATVILSLRVILFVVLWVTLAEVSFKNLNGRFTVFMSPINDVIGQLSTKWCVWLLPRREQWFDSCSGPSWSASVLTL